MEKDLEKFNEKITKVDGLKDICVYKDEDKGVIAHLGLAQCVVNCNPLELTDDKLKIAKFDKLIDKNMELQKVKKITQVPKSDITGLKKDKNIIVDKEIEVSLVWVLSNQLQVTKAYNNKEDAMAYANRWNETIYANLGK